MFTEYLPLMIGVLIGVILVVLLKLGKKEFVMNLAYHFVCVAEQRFGSGTGAIKFNMAMTELYKFLPWYLRILFSEEQLTEYIELGVSRLKRYLRQHSGVNLLPLDKE